MSAYRRPGEGEGRVFQRGNRYWISFYDRGKEHRESAGATEEQARAQLKTRLAEVRLERFAPVPKRMTVADLIAGYKAHRETRQAPRPLAQQLVSILKQVVAELGDWKVTDVTPLALERWAAKRMAAGVAQGTVRARLSYLSAAFSLARRRGVITARPEILVVGQPENARKGFFEPAQFRALLTHLPPAIADVTLFAYLSGWRRGEILGLSWAEVDRAARVVTLPGERSKNGRGRVLPLVGELWDLVERRWKARVIGTRLVPWVFHREGQPICRFQSAWQSACVDAGLPGKLFHDLRRTAVRDLVRAGVHTSVAKRISGHESDTIFARYNIVDVRDQAEALAAMQARRARTADGQAGGQPAAGRVEG